MRALALLVLVLAACAPAPAPAAPTTVPPDPITVCTNQLTYWAGEQLRGARDVGFDYQHMGLTAAQADALRSLVERARAQGPSLPADWVPEQAHAACTEIAAQPPRAGDPWG
jgi:type IV pilus biogenesis protein CpaD/CtpE